MIDRSLPRRRVLAALALGLTALVFAVPASAASGPTIGPHTGHYGVHRLIDSDEFPAGTCITDGVGTLHRIRIRPPLVYAVDRTDRVDSQLVGWRSVIEFRDPILVDTYVNWDDVPGSQSRTHKARATDLTPGTFKVRTYTFPDSYDVTQHLRYRISYTLLWYKPGSTTKVTGRAVDVPEYYETRISGTTTDAIDDYYGCYSQST